MTNSSSDEHNHLIEIDTIGMVMNFAYYIPGTSILKSKYVL